MSATGRSDIREPDDFYETPAWVVEALLPHLPTGGKVLDPGCGSGAILRAIMATPPFVHADLNGIEIHEGRADEARALFGDARKFHVQTGDFLTAHIESHDLIIGNPPFSLAMAFVEKSLALAKPYRGTVAMLLRMNWLASQERSTFHRANAADLFILPRRPSFCASLKCKPPKEEGSKGCGWAVMQRVDAPRPKRCPTCGSTVAVVTSDSTEYAWFVWGPGRGNRWQLLAVPELAAA